MSQIVAIVLLAFTFGLATWRNISMGAVALVVAYGAGVFYYGLTAPQITSGFPGAMFITLFGVTYFFGIGRANGTVGQIVESVVNMVHGKVGWIPWVFFLLAAGITASGAVSVATYSILIPMGLAFAKSHRISPLLMGLSILNGTNAGGFSPVAVYFTIVRGVFADNGVEIAPIPIFVATFIVNVLLNLFVFYLLGRRTSRGKHGTGSTVPAPPSVDAMLGVKRSPWSVIQLTTVGLMVGIIIGGVGFRLDVGFLALTAAVILAVLSPDDASRGLVDVGWGVILLIGRVVTYINMLDTAGVIDELAVSVAGIGTPLFAALLMLFIAAIVSAFASTNAMFVVLVPLAAPLLVAGDVSSLGFAIALCLSASVVDSSPFSTAGALVLANTEEHQQDRTFRGLAIWASSMIGVAPLLTWACFVALAS
jgi:hypothetical protein